MASIRRRGERWQAQIRRSGCPTVSRSFRLKADAERWAAQVDDVAGTWAFRLLGRRARMLALEGGSGGSAALYAPVGVALDNRRCGKW